MKAIVAVDENWGIGAGGGLLVHIPEDLKRFRRLTTGHAVVMGRRTFNSLPGGKPLPNRENIVLTRDEGLRIEGLVVLHSLEELFTHIAPCASDVFVIGGQEIYMQLLPYCDNVYVTHVQGPGIPAPEKFFPNLLDEALAKEQGWKWEIVEEEPTAQFEQLTYRYRTYRNSTPRLLSAGK